MVGGALLPGALLVLFGFLAGGYFPDSTALVALILAVALAARVMLVDDPFAGLSRAFAVAAAALGLLAVWTLASALWSDAEGRALLEFNLVVLYLLAFLLFGLIPRTEERLRWMGRGLAIGAVVVCAIGLFTHLFPDVWEPSAGRGARLDYPITYAGSLGLVASIGIVLCLYHASSYRQPPLARILGAAAIPLLAATLLFTLARTPLIALGVGLVAYVAVARPRALLTGLLATVPTSAVALIVAYRADVLFGEGVTQQIVSDGHRVGALIALCSLGAAVVRGLLLPADARLGRLRLSARARRLVVAGASTAALLAGGLAFVALGAHETVSREWDRLSGGELSAEDNPSGLGRLTETGTSGDARIQYWTVALDRFAEAELIGEGAGTFAHAWAQDRPEDARDPKVENAHSVYLETLAELGLVGAVLVVLPIALILITLAARSRGRSRSLYGLLFAITLAWAVHAALDWDWEMPVTTLWVFAVGGAALAAPRGRRMAPRGEGLLVRAPVALAVLLVAVVPFQVWLSQTYLGAADEAFERADCEEAIDSALSSASVLSVRAEPYEILGYCDLRLGENQLAVRMFESAVARDPDNWRYHYGLAMARAVAGEDPRPAARSAVTLNPRNPFAQEAVSLFGGAPDPDAWARRALQAPLP